MFSDPRASLKTNMDLRPTWTLCYPLSHTSCSIPGTKSSPHVVVDKLMELADVSKSLQWLRKWWISQGSWKMDTLQA